MDGKERLDMDICKQINKLPKPIKDYIHELESVCPADLVQELVNLRENQKALLRKNKMEMQDFIDQFTEDLQFDALKHWAAVLGIDYEEPPIDDMWPDWESELRGKIAEGMAKIGVLK